MLMLLTKPYVLCCWVPVNKRERLLGMLLLCCRMLLPCLNKSVMTVVIIFFPANSIRDAAALQNGFWDTCNFNATPTPSR